jgi:MFS family permease
MSGFLIFFAQREIGLGFDQAGKILAWPSLVWVAVAYPIGLLMDKWRAVRALTIALWISAVAYTLSFFFVVGAKTFFISSMLTGVTYWMIMLGQILLAQEIFSRERMGQLCAANTMIQSLVIACITGPLTGWLLSTLQNVHHGWRLPIVGEVELGPYRFVNLLLAGVLYLSLFAIYRLRRALVGNIPSRSIF